MKFNGAEGLEKLLEDLLESGTDRSHEEHEAGSPEAEEELVRRGADFLDLTEVLGGADVRTFGAAGIMTSNRGLVVRLADGSEFQVSIVQSRRGS